MKSSGHFGSPMVCIGKRLRPAPYLWYGCFFAQDTAVTEGLSAHAGPAQDHGHHVDTYVDSGHGDMGHGHMCTYVHVYIDCRLG